MMVCEIGGIVNVIDFHPILQDESFYFVRTHHQIHCFYGKNTKEEKDV